MDKFTMENTSLHHEWFRKIEPRQPVLSEEKAKKFDSARLDNQWLVVTEIARRSIFSSDSFRQQLTELVSDPVGEDLPQKLFNLVRINQLDDRIDEFESQLGEYLQIPVVPDSAIQPNIEGVHAPMAKSVIEHLFIDRYGIEEETLRTEIDNYANSSQAKIGVYGQEIRVILRRMRFSRDVKILALGAEIVDQHGQFTKDTQGNILLPSGVKITVHTSDEIQVSDFLHPDNWQQRRQIKSRTYSIAVNDRQYLLKERKTFKDSGTIHTNPGEEVEPNTSEEEAILSLQLNSCPQVDPEVAVEFEHPLGVVCYPDGYSFVIYEKFEQFDDLIEGMCVIKEWILDHKDDYQALYEQALDDVRNNIRIPVIWKANGDLIPDDFSDYEDLSWEEFAEARADIAATKAFYQDNMVLSTLGYEQVDRAPNYGWKIIREPRPRIVKLIYDLEYIKPKNQRQHRSFSISEDKKMELNLHMFRGNPKQRAMYYSVIKGEMAEYFL